MKSDSDTGERVARIALLLRIGLPAWLGLIFIHVGLNANGRLSDRAMYIWLAADPFLAVAIAFAIGTMIERTSRGFVSMVLAGGNIPYAHQYSEQDALIAQGRIDDAVTSFRALIVGSPRDLEARLRLAALLAGPAGRREDAEREFLEVRALAPSPQQTAVLSNALIDLYRAMGRRDDMMIELRRFARRFPDTRGGQAAADYLDRLRAEDVARPDAAP
jgi:tetratricopeptide (TPR) repeat protein